MRQSFSTALLTTSIAAVLVAPAVAGGAPAWTQARAERVLVRDATIHLAPAERVSLESELRQAVARFRGLELGALEEGDDRAFGTYRSLGNRFRGALQSVQDGLRIDDAACTGSGRAIERDRFKQFYCLVTSEVLRIPSAELDLSNGGMPAVVEGQQREIGPLVAQIRVQVTGKSTLAYR